MLPHKYATRFHLFLIMFIVVSIPCVNLRHRRYATTAQGKLALQKILCVKLRHRRYATAFATEFHATVLQKCLQHAASGCVRLRQAAPARLRQAASGCVRLRQAGLGCVRLRQAASGSVRGKGGFGVPKPAQRPPIIHPSSKYY